ncbi:hypothetical protein [Nakamurella deserti]|uniref:hypothetical protein n=1 Tax=Nakamurella deserti TaxID=2164074 RepID=UPI0013004F74|nr:hypothetical protein [Nakamurella deserti]
MSHSVWRKRIDEEPAITAQPLDGSASSVRATAVASHRRRVIDLCTVAGSLCR